MTPHGSENALHKPAVVLANLQLKLDSLHSQTRARSWGVSQQEFRAAVELSVRKRFAETPVTEGAVENYLDTLHSEDLVLATGCLQGSEAAWEHFVASYRPYLRASAVAITRNGDAGIDLADSLFAELYGLVDGKRAEASLFRYFHGRSSLKTWLRSVLAQRHVDRLRQTRRWQSLDSDESAEKAVALQPPAATPDPERERYLRHFVYALTVCLSKLDAEERRRLELYYAREKTLAEIGRLVGEHESSVSRNLERTRTALRRSLEEYLRKGCDGDTGATFPGMSDAQIALCIEYAGEDAPIDFRQFFPSAGPAKGATSGKGSS